MVHARAEKNGKRAATRLFRELTWAHLLNEPPAPAVALAERPGGSGRRGATAPSARSGGPEHRECRCLGVSSLVARPPAGLPAGSIATRPSCK
ncbi:unnamed protein product [Lampetra fluviatilis]